MKRRYMISPDSLGFRQVSVFDQLRNGSQKTRLITRIPTTRVPELVAEMNARGWTEFTPQ